MALLGLLRPLCLPRLLQVQGSAVHVAQILAQNPLCMSPLQQRRFAAEAAPEAQDDETITVTVSPYKGHRVDPPATEVQTSKGELMHLFKTMLHMRRVEIAADMLYKTKFIHGFLHLADGQEAIPAGIEAGISFDDSIIQSYRDHLTYLGRGGTLKELFSELMGRVDGAVKGVGGSMHLYKKEHNYYGGSGIVGEQVPVGAGIALAHKIKKDGNVCFTIYGDGAANQGQIYEAFNMSALWELPVVYVVENNHYGMGTAAERAAKSAKYYTRGDYIPGMWVDGMDVLAVKNAAIFAKQHVLEKGPIILEMDTYRYHGHSISDPGSSYRNRDEIQGMRKSRDPIEHVKTLLLEHNFADATELKKIEKAAKKEVDDAIKEAKDSPPPPIEYLWNNTYKDGLGAKLRPMEMGRPKIQL